MAIWQFSVEFIPRGNLIKYFGEIPKQIDEEIYWQGNFIEGVFLPNDYEEFLSVLGEKEKLRWTPNSLNWGDYDNGTHISIDLQDEGLPTVNARFHVGELDLEFVKTVLEFARMCQCVLLTNDREIFEPKLELFIKALRNSNSYRFCKNPVEYLQSDEVREINSSNRKIVDEIQIETK